ncbi:MAG TPA: hypothetical protein VFV19_13995 [Candidatus Polarisedimenticolaceae bacterium]|nr:hypothetical protein [Candidatus Polarisedimenticolaceae bacterium]
MAYVRKPVLSGQSIDWRPWAVARFRTEYARDGFLCAIANTTESGWDAAVMPDDGLGAQVRWRPGWFLRLNDLAYFHGGRIVLNGS